MAPVGPLGVVRPLTERILPQPARLVHHAQAFEFFDVDRDGYISHSELYRGLVLLDEDLGDVSWPQVEAMSNHARSQPNALAKPPACAAPSPASP